MGGFAYRAGNYQLVVMDYAFDDVLTEEIGGAGTLDKDFFNTKIPVKIEKVGSRSAKEIMVRINKLHTIVRDKKGRWNIDWEDGEAPRQWLFKRLRKKQIPVTIVPELTVWRRDNPNVPRYFLQSAIGDENIIVSPDNRVEFIISGMDDITWLGSKGFSYG